MSQGNTRIERFVLRIKSKPLVASLIGLGTIIIALSTFTDAARNLLRLIERPSPEEARAELSRLSLGYSPATFFLTAREGDVLAVKLLLAAGIDPNVSDNEGRTALRWAASEGHVPVMEALLDGKADVNYRPWKDGATALVFGAHGNGNPNVLRVLIEAGADSESIKDATHAAAAAAGRHGRRQEALRFLLDRDPDVAATRDDNGDTLLINAAKGGDVDIVRMVLGRGATVNEKGARGLTALHIAAEGGDEAVVRLLLDSGADVNARDEEGMYPLHEAADAGRDVVVGMILNAGADVNAQCECPEHYGGGATPLMMASQDARIAVVRLLLDRGADSNAKSKEGWTALLLAADTCTIGGGADLVQLLLDKGADVNVQLGGVTPLMRAQRLPCVDTTRALLDKGADVDIKDKDGWTAAMYALQSGSVDAVRPLFKRGARLNTRMPDGMTPLEWVANNLKGERKAEMTRLLEGAGAK